MIQGDPLYDAVILGAGINGCGIARELSFRGARVLVLDKGPIGGGTSSRSSRLIHGGLRYLETRQFGLVRESLRDRLELLNLYPDLVSIRPFFLPIYDTSPRPAWMLWVGVKLYDLLAGRRNPHRSHMVSRAEFLAQFRALKPEGIRAVLMYCDGKTNDLALTRRVAEDARGAGCLFCEGVDVRSISWDLEGFSLSAGEGEYRTRTLVNATGPWIDEAAARYGLPTRFKIRKVSGIHFTVDGLLVPEPMFMQTSGKRIFFIIPEPENGQTMIGTTEREEFVPIDEVVAHHEDIDYLIRQANAYLKDEFQIRPQDVKEVLVGVRPLVAKKADPTDLSRESELDLHTRGETRLLNVYGGKLTTFLSLSRRAVRVLGKL